MTRLAALGLLCALAAPAADSLDGRVWELAGEQRRPLAKALVSLSPDGRGPVVGATRSGPDGRWRILGPLDGRYYVRASRPGYYVVEADGAAASSVLVDCSGACGPVGFVLRRGGVVAGVVEDDQGEPVHNVSVRLEQADGADEDRPEPNRRFSRGRRGWPGGSAGDRTDDRGRFRIAAVRPGRYRVRTQFLGRADAVRFKQSGDIAVEVAAGEEIAVRVTAVRDADNGLRISGVVSGVDLGRPGRHMLHAQPDSSAAGRARFGRRMVGLEQDGEFAFEGLPPGRYFFSYSFFPNRNASQEVPLGSVELRRDAAGLTLSPVPALRVAGRFELDSDAGIRGAGVALIPRDGGPPTQIYTPGVGREFHRGGLQPGIYSVFARNRDWYLAGVSLGGEPADPAALPLTANVDDLVIRLSDRFARVEGRLRPAAGRYTVTLSSGDRDESRPTDQNGGFLFERLTPGDYGICVRPLDASPGAPCAIERRFPAEPDAVIELELSLP